WFAYSLVYHSFPTRRSSDLSAGVAQGACLVAGAVYLVVGLFPIGMGLLARQLWPEGEMPSSTVAAFAQQFFSPTGMIIFTLALRSEEHTSELQSRENLVCRL